MSNSQVKRRTLLKQLGAASFLAVPVFRMALAEAQAQTTAPKRLLLIQFPGGLPHYVDRREEVDYSWTGAMSPLMSLEPYITFFKDIQSKAVQRILAQEQSDTHGGGTRSMFTGGDFKSMGLYSIDQMLAEQIGNKTRFDSVQIGVGTDGGEGQEGLFQGLGNRRCIFKNGAEVKPDQDAAVLFARLFGAAAATPTASGSSNTQLLLDARNRYARGKSLLDHLIGQVTDIKGLAGSHEQAKLDQHLTALRELERGLQDPDAAGSSGGGVPMPSAACASPSINGGADFPKVAADMTQIAYQAINCDLTRILSFQWLGSGDQVQTFPWVNVNDTHHGLEHGSSDPDDPKMRERFVVVQRWILEQVATLMNLLKATADVNGNLLDNSISVVTTDMSTGDHEPDPYQIFLIGKGGGAVTPGRTLSVPGRSHNDLLISVGNAMGGSITTIGYPEFCTGPIALTGG